MPPAARVTDMHTCPMVTGIVPHVGGPILPPCEPTVLICGLPAARVSDMATCVGPPDVISMGSTKVMIGALAAARIGDPTVHGGVIILGCLTVIIGGGGSVMSLSEAQGYMDQFKQTDIPFDYPTDCCYARARKMCAEMERDGFSPEKFWYGGNLNQSDLHPHKPDGSIVSFPDASHPISWRYHVAPLVKVLQADGSTVKMVLDPSLSDKPLTEGEWKNLAGSTSDPREHTSDSKLNFPWNKTGSLLPPDPGNVMTESEADTALQEHRDARDGALHP